jgi:hypothetical protein
MLQTEKEINTNLIYYNGYLFKAAFIFFGKNENGTKIIIQVVFMSKIIEGEDFEPICLN